MQILPRETDVLIIGAGPTGLALAAELHRCGTRAIIIDRQEAGANTSRACVVHARTLEVLAPLGVTRGLLERGVKVPIFRVRDRDRPLMSIDFGVIESAYPFTLMIEQSKVEQGIFDRLQFFGGKVVRKAELVSVKQGLTHVEAQICVAGSMQTVQAKWLVGCDGMHSHVREQVGIDFIGGEYEESFVLADARMAWPLSRDEVTLFYSPKGLVVVAPLPDDHFRIVATVSRVPENPDAAFMQAILDARGPAIDPGQVREIVWSSRFHVHHRVAQTLRRDRVLLCGDSAHVHSPAGGQGMNTGIQDAISLAAPLVATLLSGRDAQLDDWARARHGVALNVVALTDRMTRLATIKSSAGRAVRNAAVAIAGHLPQVRAALAKSLAEIA